MGREITTERITQFKENLVNNGKSANTIQKYMGDFHKLTYFLDGQELSGEKMSAYKEWLVNKNYKKRSVNSYLNIANKFCDVMGWRDMKVSLIRLELEDYDTGGKHITASVYRRLVNTAKQHDMEDVAMLIQVLCHMDLRFIELEQLTVSALQLGYVEVKRKGSVCAAYLPEMIRKDLELYASKRGIVSGIIFRTRNGNVVDRSNFLKKLKYLCELADVDAGKVSINRLKKPDVEDYYPYFPV